LNIATIKSYYEAGPGYVLLFFSNDLKENRNYNTKITRPGFTSPNLGPEGWHVADYNWELKYRLFDESGALILTPSIVCAMELGSNYVFIIEFDPPISNEFVVSWRGVPGFRKEDVPPSPILVPQKPIHRPDINSYFTTIITEDTKVEPQVISVEPIIKPVIPEKPKKEVIERKKIKCPNPDCSAVILSTFKECSFCKTKINF